MDDNIGFRINKVRSQLNLSMEKFGNKIGISKSSVNKLEKGINQPSEQTIKLICSVYNVDYVWLTEGIGDDMFISIPDSKIDQLIEDYGLKPEDKWLVRGYLEAPPDIKQQVADYLWSIVNRELAKREKEGAVTNK